MTRRMKRTELTAGQLRWTCDPKVFGFRSTENAEPLDGVLGQARALESIRLGLKMSAPGYNIYVAGLSGTGKTTTVRTMLESLAKEHGDAELFDLVYVNNFKDPTQPRAMRLAAGCGRKLENEMEYLVAELKRVVPALFENDDFKRRRDAIAERYKDRQRTTYQRLEEDLKKAQFTLVQIQMGSITRPGILPMIDGEPVQLEQLDELTQEGKIAEGDASTIREKHGQFQNRLEDAMREARALDKQFKSDIADLEKNAGLSVVSGLIRDIGEKIECADLAVYLEEVKEEVVNNLSRFQEREEQQPQMIFPGMEMQSGPDEFTDFQVNVVVDNSETQGPPIIVENTPTHRNLFGTIERTQHASGQWTTDFTKIRAGSLLKANGGYLVFNLLDAVTEVGVWKTLKRTLKARCMEFDTPDPYFFFTFTAMKPMSTPVNVKIVGIGDNNLYYLLHAYDEEFTKIFKVKADFDSVMVKDEDQIRKVSSFVHKIVTDEKLIHFSAKGVAALVEEAVRMSGRQKRLTTRFSALADVIREASHWAGEGGAKYVGPDHVDQAIAGRIRRHALVEDRMQEAIDDGLIMIDTEGAVSGQVNGLAVLSMGDRMFGKPSRITAQVSMGRSGVINIEREAKLSGKIHDKGMLILTGFLRSRFAQDKPLSLSVSVTFEQNYGGIDGDSASSTELYAILSELAGAPLRQDLAVTGSVNQLGQIQPIGGVNAKIEGFFDVCNARGLTGSQGVLIPVQNVGDLMLRKDVVDAVRKKKFHVYPVTTIDEGISLLTGVPAGERGATGSYPKTSINGRVDKRLRDLAVGLKEFDKPAKKKAGEKEKTPPKKTPPKKAPPRKKAR